MQQIWYYAFYGSLRRGMALHDQFRDHLDYQFSMWLSGYDLYALESYPYAVRSRHPNSKIKVDVFTIRKQEVVDEINQIELEAGYVQETILVKGMPTRIYLFSKSANDQKVISGDWVEFFGS